MTDASGDRSKPASEIALNQPARSIIDHLVQDGEEDGPHVGPRPQGRVGHLEEQTARQGRDDAGLVECWVGLGQVGFVGGA